MAQNFIACDREQERLLPPSLRDWLPEDHFAWFVLDAVAAMNLEAFFGAYRRDGWGRAAHDPAMMVALLVYGGAGINRHGEGDGELYIEGVAIHGGPESCVGVREGAGEALTGVRVGWAIEPRNEG